jgi:hypothetical protein
VERLPDETAQIVLGPAIDDSDEDAEVEAEAEAEADERQAE